MGYGADRGVQRRGVRHRRHALALDLSVPESDLDHLWRGIAHQWPSYLGFATSFITIGGLWLGHHGLFRRMEYANNDVMRVNLLLLMAVSFLPFPTRLLAETIALAFIAPQVAAFGYLITAIVSVLRARSGKSSQEPATD